jgi:hypothetical protein
VRGGQGEGDERQRLEDEGDVRHQTPERLLREQVPRGGLPEPDRAHSAPLALDAEHVEEHQRDEQAEQSEA